MAKQPYIFKRTIEFKRSFDQLSPAQQTAAKEAFKVFKANPFDPALKIHKINKLSSLRRRIVRAVVIQSDLRSVFEIHDNVILSTDIGSHDIYKK